MSAPNFLRVGTAEKVFVECQNCSDENVVKVKVMNFPSKTIRLIETSVALNKINKFQGLATITVMLI